jgi:hypothetical protein
MRFKKKKIGCVLTYSINKSSDKVLVATVRKFLALNGTSMFTSMFTGARLNQVWSEALYKVYTIPMFVVLKLSEFVEIKCQLDATDEFLLQILLLAQHVSSTIMPIIRFAGCSPHT